MRRKLYNYHRGFVQNWLNERSESFAGQVLLVVNGSDTMFPGFVFCCGRDVALVEEVVDEDEGFFTLSLEQPTLVAESDTPSWSEWAHDPHAYHTAERRVYPEYVYEEGDVEEDFETLERLRGEGFRGVLWGLDRAGRPGWFLDVTFHPEPSWWHDPSQVLLRVDSATADASCPWPVSFSETYQVMAFYREGLHHEPWAWTSLSATLRGVYLGALTTCADRRRWRRHLGIVVVPGALITCYASFWLALGEASHGSGALSCFHYYAIKEWEEHEDLYGPIPEELVLTDAAAAREHLPEWLWWEITSRFTLR